MNVNTSELNKGDMVLFRCGNTALTIASEVRAKIIKKYKTGAVIFRNLDNKAEGVILNGESFLYFKKV